MAMIGFIGLGMMGRPMCEHLLKGGHAVQVYDVDPKAIKALSQQGAAACSSPAQAATGVEVLITMLPNGWVVDEVLFGQQGAASALARGTLVADMSSIAADQAKRYAERLKTQGVDFVDAPVSGGQVGAQQATLSIMAGGNERVFSALKPYFELMGKNINLVGEVGCGQIAKSANQIIVAITIAAVGEALMFAKAAGAKPSNVRSALMGGFAQSRILDLHGERMIKRNFVPGGTSDIQVKDIQIALDMMHQAKVSLPALSLVQQTFHAVRARPDGGKLDHAALALVLEGQANQTIATKDGA